MTSTYYGIRHKATGELMPQLKKDKGYSHWNPSHPEHEVIAKTLGFPRILQSRRQAIKCIIQWAANPNAEMGYRSESAYGFISDDQELKSKFDGRKKEDLEVVEFTLELIDNV